MNPCRTPGRVDEAAEAPRRPFALVFALAWLGASLALPLAACGAKPDPRVVPYAAAAELCAQQALLVDGGQAERWRSYDECELRAYKRWAGLDAGAP